MKREEKDWVMKCMCILRCKAKEVKKDLVGSEPE